MAGFVRQTVMACWPKSYVPAELIGVRMPGKIHERPHRPGIRVRASSSGLGWRGIAASVQSELPFSGSYDAVSDHLVVLHVGRPARVAGRTAGKLVDSANDPSLSDLRPPARPQPSPGWGRFF